MAVQLLITVGVVMVLIILIRGRDFLVGFGYMAWRRFLVECSSARLDIKGMCGAGVEVVSAETRRSTSLRRMSVISLICCKRWSWCWNIA